MSHQVSALKMRKARIAIIMADNMPASSGAAVASAIRSTCGDHKKAPKVSRIHACSLFQVMGGKLHLFR